MYLCNGLKLCRCSTDCGVNCVLTKQKEFRLEPISGQHIVCNNLNQLNWWREQLRQTDIEYKVEGFKIIFI